MTTQEFSNQFDTLVSSYRRFKDFDKAEVLDSIEFDEYEKSVYLTEAQDEVVIGLYDGRNNFGESFETTEELRRYLESLVKTVKCGTATGAPSGVSASSAFYTLPTDILFIVYEQAKWNDNSLGCYDGSIVNINPVTHDEYNRIRKNPFRGPTKRRILRLDCGNGIVELVSKYGFTDYMIRYLSDPGPIIVEALPEGLTIKGESAVHECSLNKALHELILRRAVQLALASKGIYMNNQ